MGRVEIDLRALDQVIAPEQVAALAGGLRLAKDRLVDGRRDLPAVLEGVMEAVARRGLDVLDEGRRGNLAAFRRQDLAAVINRLRGLEARPVGGEGGGGGGQHGGGGRRGGGGSSLSSGPHGEGGA